LWINGDDQGRLSGDPDEIKYLTCPNIDHITKKDIPELLKQLETEKLILVYSTSTTKAIQLLDWWQEQHLQWAYPSRYPPPESWQDRLRYHASPTEIVTKNWPSKSDSNSLPSKLPNSLPKEHAEAPLTTPSEIKKEKGKRKRRGRGNLPSALGSTSPSLIGSLFQLLVDTHFKGWGRMPDSRETAQLRDLAEELCAAGGATEKQIYDAFKEGATHEKYHISYVRAILLAWLGIGRGPPG